ncbi:MAG: M36 family metallopeptidase [Blastocatellia bacterium]
MKRTIPLLLSLLLVGCCLLTFATSAQRRLTEVLTGFSAGQTSTPVTTTQAARQTPRGSTPRTLPDFDLRFDYTRSLENLSDSESALQNRNRAQSAGRQTVTTFRLQRELPTLNVRWSSLSGTPTRMWSYRDALSAPDRADAETVARQFLKVNDDLFRLSAREVDELKVARRYQTAHNGVTHLTLQQQVGGIDIFQGDYALHLDRAGRVIATSGELIPDAGSAISARQPQLQAAGALRIAAQNAGAAFSATPAWRKIPAGDDQRQEFERGADFGGPVAARLVWFPLTGRQLRLAWELMMPMRETPDYYLMVIDAERGSLLFRYNLTSYDENPLKPHGPIYTKESPRPNLPRTSASPAVVEREDRPFHAEPYNGRTIFEAADKHYDWWAGNTASNLISNNTSTYLDRDVTPNLPDEPRLGVPDGNFTFPLDLTQSPLLENNQKAAQVNMFYWVNRFHDILYSFGFTEAAGNFQTDNFGLGGLGSDAVNAEAQDGGGTNNANFSSPPDGTPGRMQMYLFDGTPQLDGDLDQTVVLHELTHGLSSRLIGNSRGLTGTQARGMGEGWSDFISLALIVGENDDPNGIYPHGQYLIRDYTNGIRRYPYSTDLTVSPLTFGDFSQSFEVHDIGEIWCSALWEMRALLIKKYGAREGQRQSLQLVVDGMKLTPVAPTFLDARDAILVADRVNNAGANQCLIWQAFAKRGMGFAASTKSGSDSAPVEAKDTPFYCSETGILRLDRNSYIADETIRISLGDANATGNVVLQVSSTVTGDAETLTLTQQPGIPGSYTGALRVVSGSARPNDGLIQGRADRSDQIVVVYNDPATANGSPAQISATVKVTREQTVLEDNIERGNQGWIATGDWALTTERAAAGRFCWTDSPNTTYFSNSDTMLTSRLFDLTGLSDVTLTIAHSYDLENSFDFGLVEYSTDDGVTWNGAASFTGKQTDFKQSRISLGGLDGQARARFRFRLLTDTTVIADGWYIDDIRLIARSAGAAATGPGDVTVPVISSIAPAFGLPAGGTKVTISGQNFTENDNTLVTFDGIAATGINVLSGTTLTAIAPAHAAGQVTVRVICRNRQAALPGGFTYYTAGSGGATPTLTTLFPNTGSVGGGTAVTLIGASFTPESRVSFGSREAAVTFINASTLRVLTPPGTAAGAVNVSVINGANSASLINFYNYAASSPPQVQILSPAGGEILYTGGTVSLRWRSTDDRAIVRHRVALMRNTGSGLALVSTLASDLSGDAQSFTWAIPPGVEATDKARISVRAIDDEGAETEAASSGDFTLVRRWEPVAPLPVALNRLQVTTDGKYVYAIGGRASTSSTSTTTLLQRFDPAATTPAWFSDTLTPMPAGLNGSEAVYLNGKIYIPGGVNNSVLLSAKHYAYDVAANTWAEVADLPVGAFLEALAADPARGVYYHTGGLQSISASSGSTTIRSYDPKTNTWTDLPPMKTARFGHRAAVIEGKLYVYGGLGPVDGLDTGEVFDFTTRQWSPIAASGRPRMTAFAFTGSDQSGNPLWVMVGGVVPGTSVLIAGADAYDVRNNRWVALDNSYQMLTPRSLGGSTVVGDYFYAIGGSTGSSNSACERLRANNLSLQPFDQAPVVAVPAAQIAIPDVELSFAVAANDLGSGVPVTLTAAGLPDTAVFTPVSTTSNSARGSFKWTPAQSDVGRTVAVAFTAADGQLSDTKVVSIRVVAAGAATAVGAADYRQGQLASDSIVALFGTNLAIRTEDAQVQPLPYEIAGTTVTVNGVSAQLFFVSPTQINFAVPSGLPPGPAAIIVSNPAGSYSYGTIEIVAASPALFTLDASGRGDAAALATVDGITYTSPPFEVTVNGRPNILVLFGTGFRNTQTARPDDDNGVAEAVTVTIDGKPANVLYAGAQGGYSGLDQLNIELPSALAGQGLRRVEVLIRAGNTAANAVTIQIR